MAARISEVWCVRRYNYLVLNTVDCLWWPMSGNTILVFLLDIFAQLNLHFACFLCVWGHPDCGGREKNKITMSKCERCAYSEMTRVANQNQITGRRKCATSFSQASGLKPGSFREFWGTRGYSLNLVKLEFLIYSPARLLLGDHRPSQIRNCVTHSACDSKPVGSVAEWYLMNEIQTVSCRRPWKW